MVQKVAVVMGARGIGHLKLVTAFNETITQLMPKAKITEFVPDSPQTFSIEKLSESIPVRSFDLVVAIGIKATQAMQNSMCKQGLTIPLLSVAAQGWETTGDKYKYMTEVTTDRPSEVLPLDVIMLLCGLEQRIVIVYRADSNKAPVNQMLQYADDANVQQVISIAVPAMAPIAEFLVKELKANDIVIMVRAGLYPEDTLEIEKVCQMVKANFFCSANGLVPATALCGYGVTPGYDAMGARAAHLTEKILIHNSLVTNIHNEALENSSFIIINTDILQQRGIPVPTQDYIISPYDKKKYRIVYRSHYPVIAAPTIEHENRIADHLTWQSKAPTQGIECVPIPITGTYTDHEYRQQIVTEAMSSMGGTVTVVGGEQIAFLLQQEMLKQEKFRSLIIMRNSDDQPAQRASIRSPGWPANRSIQRITLETIQPRFWFDLLQHMVPQVQHVGTVYGYTYAQMPPHLQRRLRAIEQECIRRGLTLSHNGYTRGDTGQLSQICLQMVEKVDAMIGLPDMLTATDELVVSAVCFSENRRYVGSDLGVFGRGSAMLQPKYERVAEKIVTMVRQASLGKKLDSGNMHITWLDLCL